ncbi:hypothetical protein PPL_12139 [Heterostelium album PN500]|uniref:Phosphatidylinositol-4-phosphate 5-kinase n=1 Tax=Heterostelium pallidum (strain ATCC 26659 / Pp 5 / PN500) TaxID=670386 RepID=D3BLT5_HETP5|nr:hypothetical protein PPL_12139 [Heterostelium album PN500]EFA77536.1 hypothetical protein PPL_12139 [Heterostelium album PN500]|eukprot:XP_020429664.1 hypothetical protein PPL_12139 [Heterostelium album PN500]
MNIQLRFFTNRKGLNLFNSYNRNKPLILSNYINSYNKNDKGNNNILNRLNEYCNFSTASGSGGIRVSNLEDFIKIQPNDKLKSLINTLEVPDISRERSILFERHSGEKRVREELHRTRIPNVQSPRDAERSDSSLEMGEDLETDFNNQQEQLKNGISTTSTTSTSSSSMETVISPTSGHDSTNALLNMLAPDSKGGEVVSKKGTQYKGALTDDGLPNGPGEYETVDGEVYIGEFVLGMKQGAGKYIWRNNSSYDGYWMHDKRSGVGKMVEEREIYEGEWLNDQRHGAGLLLTEGIEIRGEWVNNELVSGHELHVKSGLEYFGSYRNGRWHGAGKLAFKDGTIFEGNFVDGTRSGVGRLISDDQIFECEWVNGAPNGSGKFSSHDWTCEGVWLNGACQHGTLKRVGYSVYIGEIRNFVPHGEGEEFMEDQCYYKGEYRDGKRNGFGTFKWADGTVYQGNWVDDLRVGFGQMIFANGKGWEGEFNETIDGQAESLETSGKFKPIDLNNPENAGSQL